MTSSFECKMSGCQRKQWSLGGLFKCVCVCASQEEEFRSCPRLDIIQPLPESCEEISSDALTVRNFQENECRDYRLGNGKRDGGKLKSFTALN